MLYFCHYITFHSLFKKKGQWFSFFCCFISLRQYWWPCYHIFTVQFLFVFVSQLTNVKSFNLHSWQEIGSAPDLTQNIWLVYRDNFNSQLANMTKSKNCEKRIKLFEIFVRYFVKYVLSEYFYVFLCCLGVSFLGQQPKLLQYKFVTK